jgi:hypothetical protein
LSDRFRSQIEGEPALARRNGREVWRLFLDWFKPTNQEDGHLRSGRSDRFQPVSATHSPADPAMNFDETAEEFSEGELLEFLEADLDPVSADPEFRENLREQLWALVQEGATSLPKDH